MSVALSETPIREALVTSGSPWREVSCPDEVDSTNAVSIAAARPWRVVTTRHQRAGRGRHARAWASPPGASVALSLTVPLPAASPRWGWLPLVTGLAVLDALGELTGAPDRFVLKWPNDVLAREDDGSWRKICGILCETTPGEQGPLVVAGIGVNMTLSRDQLPVPTATSLDLAGLAVPAGGDVVVAIARAFARRYEPWYGGSLAALRMAYRERCDTIGRDVDVHLPDDSVARGRAVDVADDGELVVDVASPSAGADARPVRRTFAAGDVVHLRPRTGPDVASAGPGAPIDPAGRA